MASCPKPSLHFCLRRLVLRHHPLLLGGCPYSGIDGTDLLRLLRAGYRRELAPLATLEINSLMGCCLSGAPGERPEFVEIAKELEYGILRDDDKCGDGRWGGRGGGGNAGYIVHIFFPRN